MAAVPSSVVGACIAATVVHAGELRHDASR